MDSMLSGMKRAAAVLQTTARGSGDLGMVIYHQKEVTESWLRLSHAKIDATKALATWGKREGEAMMQFFESQNQIDALFISLIDDMVKKYEYNRKCFKEILKGEKTLEDLTEKKKEWETKVAKSTKQYEGSKKGKQKQLETDLVKAKSMLEQATDDLDRHSKNHARFKFQKLAEAYKDHAAIQVKFHYDAAKISQAQTQLNQIYLQENFTELSSPRLHAVTVEAQTVLNTLTEALNDSKADPLHYQGSTRSNTSSDGAWDFDEYSDEPQQEISDGPDMQRNANRPLPPVPGDGPIVYDNNPIPQGEYLEMDYAEYEPYVQEDGNQAQQRSEQYLNVYEPLEKAKEPPAQPLTHLMDELKLEQQNQPPQNQPPQPPQNQGYLSMNAPPSQAQRAPPNPYGPAPGQLYPAIYPNSSPPDGAEFLPPPPPELLNKDVHSNYDNTGPHDFV